MSEGPSAAQDSAVGQKENVHRHSEAHQGDSRAHACMPGQRRGSADLEFHSPADSEDDTDSSNNDNESVAVGIAPPLGQHEKYHVFFCYSSADAPWVKNMIQKLESDELGFKCCFHERDFLPGMAIIDNIIRSIQKSQKTVFVLSRDFVDSRWCNFERQMVMGANLREENKKVIPVMLRECVLPDFLQHMTYLEEWTPYFFDRFIGALKECTSDDPSSQSDSFSPFTYNPNFNNGQQLLKIEAAAACCPPCAQFDDQIVPTELTSKGIRIPRKDYYEAISKLTETGKMQGFNCCSSEACFWIPTCLVIFPVLAVFYAFFILFYMSTPDDYIDASTDAALYNEYVALAVLLAALHVVLVFRCISRIKMKILEDLMARSSSDSPTSSNMHDPPESESASTSCVVTIEVDDAAPLLSEGSDDACADTDFQGGSSSQTSRMSALKAEAEALLLKYSDQYVRLLVTIKIVPAVTEAEALLLKYSEEYVRLLATKKIVPAVTEAEALLLKYSEEYVRLLVTKMLPQPRQSRGHTQQGACLCQLVEMREFGWKLDREQTSVV
uniref:TIR domain-containing protein n=1 Tax=Branchiostoma floridae TaxID=7739 RepID=C3Y4F2_BRAFL|eukprot:XP_002608816.1 hypothetical protein BRAFLDRAFT_89683 [Branchiostoma floridae]